MPFLSVMHLTATPIPLIGTFNTYQKKLRSAIELKFVLVLLTRAPSVTNMLQRLFFDKKMSAQTIHISLQLLLK